MESSNAPQRFAPTQDDEHLNLLAIFHYVLGGLTLVIAFCPAGHLAMGLFLLLNPEEFNDAPAAFSWIFAVMFTLMPAAMMIGGWVLGGLMIYAGRCLHRRRRHLFATVVAGVECIFFPFGTVLGVFTLVVLMRPSVKARFGATDAARAADAVPKPHAQD